jgi:hypothetical protein
MKTFVTILRIVIVSFVVIIMTALTLIGYSDAHPGLTGGSLDSIMSMAALPPIYATVFLLVFVILIILYLKKPTNIKLVLLSLIMILWFLSGRMIGIIPLDGRLSTGWFYIETGRHTLCDYKTDCETTIYYQTQTESLFFWRIRVSNKNIDETIFVGPFLWNRAQKLFKETVESGKYYK